MCVYSVCECVCTVCVNVCTVFVRRGSDGKAQLVLLDHGLYDYLPGEKRVALCNLYAAIIERNESRMREHSKELGVDGTLLLLVKRVV